MNDISTLIEQVLKQPTPENLIQLQPVLLAIGNEDSQIALKTTEVFYRYMVAVREQTEVRQFPLLATALSATSTGISISQDVFSPEPTPMMRIALDTLKTTLDVIGTYQFVRQWSPLFRGVHDSILWDLYHIYWQISQRMQPDLETSERLQALEKLFKPIRDPDTDYALQLAWTVQLFQLALISSLKILRQPTQSQ